MADTVNVLSANWSGEGTLGRPRPRELPQRLPELPDARRAARCGDDHQLRVPRRRRHYGGRQLQRRLRELPALPRGLDRRAQRSSTADRSSASARRRGRTARGAARAGRPAAGATCTTRRSGAGTTTRRSSWSRTCRRSRRGSWRCSRSCSPRTSGRAALLVTSVRGGATVPPLRLRRRSALRPWTDGALGGADSLRDGHPSATRSRRRFHPGVRVA